MYKQKKVIVDTSGTVTSNMFDVESEQAVLGAVLYDNAYFNHISTILDPEAFFNEAHQKIFRAMKTLKKRGNPIDEILIGDVLKETDDLANCGGYAYLAELLDCVPSSGNIRKYASITNKGFALRNLQRYGLELLNELAQPDANAKIIANKFKNLVANSANSKDKKDTSIKAVMFRAFQDLEKIVEAGGGITGQSTGFFELDQLTSGFQNTDLIILAARPSMGKTAFALNIAEHASKNLKKKGGVIVIFSFEMGDKQLSNRLCSSLGRVDSNNMRSGSLGDDDFDNLVKAMESYSGENNIHIEDDSNLNIFDIGSIVAQHDEESKENGGEGVAMVIIDYLQLVKESRPNMPREQAIAEISRNSKGMAKDFDCPVIALSQLNRELEKRGNKRPIMSDLRESGAIEQDADIIGFLYRDEVYDDKTKDRGIAELGIAKHRNGALATIKFKFQGKYTRFSDYCANY